LTIKAINTNILINEVKKNTELTVKLVLNDIIWALNAKVFTKVGAQRYH